jgi:hypothetical protein
MKRSDSDVLYVNTRRSSNVIPDVACSVKTVNLVNKIMLATSKLKPNYVC